MNTRPFHIGWFVLLVLVQPLQAQIIPEGGMPQAYLLLLGSTLTVAATNSPSRSSTLTGTFSLEKQVSPLDWDVYALQNVRWSAAESPTNAIPLTGSGSYRVSERFGNTRQLDLHLQILGLAVDVSSGAVPNDTNWPLIDLVANGVAQTDTGPVQYSVRLVAAPELRVWHYRLLTSSYFLDDCLICDHVPFYEPLRGSFDLVLVGANPLFERYVVSGVELSSSWAGQPRQISGQGSYQIGGEVALSQTMDLQLNVNYADTNQAKVFTNSTAQVQQLWPIVQIDLDETNGTFVHTFRLHLLAAPFREIWFSTAHNLTPASQPDHLIRSADVLSDPGRVVRRIDELTGQLALPPATNAYGIDAFTVAPGGAVQFSLSTDAISQTLGPLHHGDLLSDRGEIISHNQDLTQAFGIMPPVPDLGLDALQILDDGEILFSLMKGAFSETKATMLQPGDLLSSRGEVKRTNQQLLSRFHPDKPAQDYGLDACYVWPSGEIWFSTTLGFNDPQLGSITDGDLVSDQGYVVFHNPELLAGFSPLEELANFGLHGLYLVTDVTAAAPAPTLIASGLTSVTNGIMLQWQAKGRVFQVERTEQIDLPFVPASAILPGATWTDPGPVIAPSRAFYRLRQW